MSKPAPAPSPQEINRKLSVHSASRGPRSPPAAPVSGTESDSDSAVPPDILPSSIPGIGSPKLPGSASHPLSSIAERRVGSGEDSEDDDEDEEEEGGWKSADVRGRAMGNAEDTVIKAGYLWKKGERRKTWKKRWFVLRPAHLAYYKTSAEYQLLRLLELSDVHSCMPVALKKHSNTFGLVSPVRTFYLQADTPGAVQEWVKAIEEARQTLMATSTQNTLTSPVSIPTGRSRSGERSAAPVSPSPPSQPYHNVTTSDSEDELPQADRISSSPQREPPPPGSANAGGKEDSSKPILSGYLMKCGSKRRNWRKRWFILKGEKLIYSGSHMDTRPHREFSFSKIMDALAVDLPVKSQYPHTPHVISPPLPSPPEDGEDGHRAHTFKIVTTKRTLLLCAPSEEDEIKWLGAIQALISRRQNAGGVPGVSGSGAGTTKAATPDVAQAPGTVTAPSGGVKSKSRRLSGSAPNASAIPGPPTQEAPLNPV